MQSLRRSPWVLEGVVHSLVTEQVPTESGRWLRRDSRGFITDPTPELSTDVSGDAPYARYLSCRQLRPSVPPLGSVSSVTSGDGPVWCIHRWFARLEEWESAHDFLHPGKRSPSWDGKISCANRGVL